MDHTQILHTLQSAIPTGIWYLIATGDPGGGYQIALVQGQGGGRTDPVNV